MAKKKTTINTVFGERIVPPHENAEAYAKFNKRATEAMKPADLIDEIRAQIFCRSALALRSICGVAHAAF